MIANLVEMVKLAEVFLHPREVEEDVNFLYPYLESTSTSFSKKQLTVFEVAVFVVVLLLIVW